MVRDTPVRFIDQSSVSRRPADIEAQEMQDVLAEREGDVEMAARRLRISAHGLRLRRAEVSRA